MGEDQLQSVLDDLYGGETYVQSERARCIGHRLVSFYSGVRPRPAPSATVGGGDDDGLVLGSSFVVACRIITVLDFLYARARALFSAS